MSDIDDNGKIWLRGSTRPEYGVRVGKLYFVIGKENKGDSENINCYVHERFLLVDVHNSEKQYRIIRRFSLDLEPRSSGTLFNGFTKTKHADIKAVTYQDEGVERFMLDGEDYILKNDNLIDPIHFMRLAGWK